MENQLNWSSFLYNLNSKQIVAVIGNDLSMIRLDKNFLSKNINSKIIAEAGRFIGDEFCMNLYEYIAFRLWDIFGPKQPISQPITINNVISKLQQFDIPENDINNAVKNEIKSLPDDQILLQPYRNLVKLNGFETFVTVNLDNFLERAFEAESKHVNKSFNFSIPLPAVDPNRQCDPAIPKIYNLMGNIEENYFALSDEERLEYLYMLQNGSDTTAKELFDSISRKNVLFVGSSFPDWFMRFFIRILSRERLKNGVKAKYVACDTTLQSMELITFLENHSTKVIPIGLKLPSGNGSKIYQNSIEFVDDMLAQREKYLNEQIERSEVHYKERIFISYSRDDQLLAQRLRNELERNGLHVFFDEDSLKTGDPYNQVILNYIRECDFFIALISENAVRDKSRYVYETEWKSAILLASLKYKDSSYIKPFIIDQIPDTDVRIPEEIRKLNIGRIINFDDLGKTVTKFIKENKLTPIPS